jgi:hypothetical protein
MKVNYDHTIRQSAGSSASIIHMSALARDFGNDLIEVLLAMAFRELKAVQSQL